MKINYFFGSDSRSIPAYQALVNSEVVDSANQIINVVTLDNSNQVRGKRKRNDFESYCVDNNIQYSYYSENDVYDDLEIALVCSFGKIFPSDFLINNNALNNKDSGDSIFINLHLSLLPDLKGPTPVEHAILYGYSHTGISLFMIDEGIDTGKIVWQEKFEILPNSYASDLYTLSFDKFNQFINKFDFDNLKPSALVHDGSSQKVKKTYKFNDCDLSLNNVDIETAKKRIRAFNVLGPAKYIDTEESYKIHSYTETGEGFEIQLTDGKLTADIITPPGRKKMKSADWLRGKND